MPAASTVEVIARILGALARIETGALSLKGLVASLVARPAAAIKRCLS
jgi:hypothetical protein